MNRETDGRAAVLAAAAVAAACFAAGPAPTLPRLEPGFGKPRLAAALPPLPRGEALRGPTAQQRFDEILRDDRADILGDQRSAPSADLDERGAQSEKAPPSEGAAKDRKRPGAPSNGSPGRELFSAESRRPETAAREEAPPRGARTTDRSEPFREKTSIATAGRGSRELSARADASVPPAPRGRHSSQRRASAALAGEPASDARGGTDEPVASAAEEALPRAQREASLFGREKPTARRRNGPRRDARPPRKRRLSERRRPKADERRAPREKNSPRFRPLLLAKLLGPRALRPPPPELEPPAAPALARPERGPGGTTLPETPAGLAALDEVDPAAFSRDRRIGGHWDGDEYHDGDVRGLACRAEWLWLRRDGANWWAFAGGGAQVRRDGVWWTKANGVWFVVHDGAPWAWRSFQDWDAQGLFHPASGTEMVYSRDFKRVALVVPGQGAQVFDAETGEKLAKIPENRMPARRRPKLPGNLAPPDDVFAK